MAHHEQIDIYKSSFDLLLLLHRLVANFPRECRYTLGEKIVNGTTKLIVYIFKANRAKLQKRYDFLEAMYDLLQEIIIYVRLSSEMKYVPKNEYAKIVQMHTGIEKQLSGWLNYTEGQIQKTLVTN